MDLIDSQKINNPLLKNYLHEYSLNRVNSQIDLKNRRNSQKSTRYPASGVTNRLESGNGKTIRSNLESDSQKMDIGKARSLQSQRSKQKLYNLTKDRNLLFMKVDNELVNQASSTRRLFSVGRKNQSLKRVKSSRIDGKISKRDYSLTSK